MAELSTKDQALLLDMLLAARDAKEFVGGLNTSQFSASKLHQNAVIRSLEVIGEAAGQVSRDCTDALPEIPWRKITGMRHRLIHDYFDVNLEIVWEVVRDEIPVLIQTLERRVPPE